MNNETELLRYQHWKISFCYMFYSKVTLLKNDTFMHIFIVEKIYLLYLVSVTTYIFDKILKHNFYYFSFNYLILPLIN